MSDFFVDTSALAKRYIVETGSTWVRSWILPRAGNTILISALTKVEMASVLARHERSGDITPEVRKRAMNNFLLHARNPYIVIELNDTVLKEARRLLFKHQLRSLDALHLASAVVVERQHGVKVTFVSADVKLLPVAAAEGFTTDDPNLHP